MAQTPQQRKANLKFAREQNERRGKPESAYKKRDKSKSPISTTWIVLFVFLVCGGLVFELLRLVPWILDSLKNLNPF